MKIPLLENALSFLEEALDKAVKAERDHVHWKFAILHLVQAIELSLKERLIREHNLMGEHIIVREDNLMGGHILTRERILV